MRRTDTSCVWPADCVSVSTIHNIWERMRTNEWEREKKQNESTMRTFCVWRPFTVCAKRNRLEDRIRRKKKTVLQVVFFYLFHWVPMNIHRFESMMKTISTNVRWCKRWHRPVDATTGQKKKLKREKKFVVTGNGFRIQNETRFNNDFSMIFEPTMPYIRCVNAVQRTVRG